MINYFTRKKCYTSDCSKEYDLKIKSRIGGNIPILFENRIEDINKYLFYLSIEHPQFEDKMISIFIPNKYETRVENNIYPNCDIKIFITDYSVESRSNLNFTCPDIDKLSIMQFTEIEENKYQGNLIKLGGNPVLIQEENYYFNALRQNNYCFFMQVDENFYPESLLKGAYPFGYGALYLYAKWEGQQIIDIIAGFWQYS